MVNPAFRLTVSYRGQSSPRHTDYAAHEERLFQDEVATVAALLADDATSILAFSALSYAKADHQNDTPEHIVEAINANLLRKF